MANDVTDAMVEAAAKSLCEYHCVAISGPCIEERKCSGWQVWTAPAKEALHDALAARPLPEGMETTEKERAAYAKAADRELVWPESGFVGRALRDINTLRARLAEAEAALKDARRTFTVEYGDGGSIASVSYDGDALRPLIALLDAAIRARGGDNG